MLLDISAEIQYIKKLIRYKMQNLMQIDELPFQFWKSW